MVSNLIVTAALGQGVGQYLALDDQQQMYLAGRYKQILHLAPKTTFSSMSSGFFVVKLIPNGQLTWARDIPLREADLKHSFAAKINQQGQSVETLIFEEPMADRVSPRGIALDEQGFVYFSGDHRILSQATSAGAN